MPKGVYIRKSPPTPPVNKVRSVKERFDDKVDRTSTPFGCHLWTGSLDGRGYGKLQVGTLAKPRLAIASRLAWEFAFGPIPEGARVLHHCDVPSCCNPEHLFLGTTADNARDMVEKGRSLRGERAYSSKLTAAGVLEIRRLFDEGLLNQSGAARKYGVSVPLINKIVHRKAWRHLP
jgi:hypothetical protein